MPKVETQGMGAYIRYARHIRTSLTSSSNVTRIKPWMLWYDVSYFSELNYPYDRSGIWSPRIWYPCVSRQRLPKILK
jgi:hypothetical protein